MDDQQRVINFLEKPKPTETASRLACPPIYFYERETIKDIYKFLDEKKDAPISVKDSPGTFVQWLISHRQTNDLLEQRPIYASKISGRFDIGSVGQYKFALSVFGQSLLSMQSPIGPEISVGRCFARVGFIGNPSDGYFGKTISFTINKFYCEVLIHASSDSFVHFHEKNSYSSITDLFTSSKYQGYSCAIPLLKASASTFVKLCQLSGNVSEEKLQSLSTRGFNLYYQSNIPFQVGLAGSSAIICACFRALCAFYQIPMTSLVDKPLWPNHILSVEVDELKIAAGLQDRVVQFYEGLVYMDFNKSLMDANKYGKYEHLNIKSLPSTMYLAYLNSSSTSGKLHNNLRQRWLEQDQEVIEAMKQFASLVDQAKEILTNEKSA